MQIHDVRVLREGDEKIGDCTRDVADHDAADQDRRHVLYAFRNQQDEAGRQEGANEGGHDIDGCAGGPELRQGEQHRQRDGQFRAARDAEDVGSGDRIFEEGLEQEAAQRKRAAEDHREADPRQADAPEDGLRHEVTAECDRTGGDIGIKNKKQHEKQACEYDRIPPRTSSVFPLKFTHPRIPFCIQHPFDGFQYTRFSIAGIVKAEDDIFGLDHFMKPVSGNAYHPGPAASG